MITLTINQIYDLARFAGFPLNEDNRIDLDEGETLISIGECPEKGIFCEDKGYNMKYSHVAWLDEYPEEGMFGLGGEF